VEVGSQDSELVIWKALAISAKNEDCNSMSLNNNNNNNNNKPKYKTKTAQGGQQLYHSVTMWGISWTKS